MGGTKELIEGNIQDYCDHWVELKADFQTGTQVELNRLGPVRSQDSNHSCEPYLNEGLWF